MEHKYYVFGTTPSKEELAPFLEDIGEEWSIAHIAQFPDAIHYLLRKEGSWEERKKSQKALVELEKKRIDSVERMAKAVEHEHKEPWED